MCGIGRLDGKRVASTTDTLVVRYALMSKRNVPATHAPRTRRTRVGVVLPDAMLARLDGMVDREAGEDRSEVMRRLLAKGMRAEDEK